MKRKSTIRRRNGRWSEWGGGGIRWKGKTEGKREVKIVHCSDVTSGRS